MRAAGSIVAVLLVCSVVATIPAPIAADGAGLVSIDARQTGDRSVQVQVTALPGLRNPPAEVFVAAYQDGQRVAYVEAGELENDGREVITETIRVPAGRTRIVATARGEELATTIDTTPPMPSPVLKRVEIPAGDTSTITIQGSGWGDRVAARLIAPDALDPQVTGVTDGDLLVQADATIALANADDPAVDVAVDPPTDAAGDTYRLTLATEAAGDGAVNWQAVEVTVTESSPLASYRTDGQVTTAGLQQAIRDWVGGAIDGGLLQRVIRAWATGGSG